MSVQAQVLDLLIELRRRFHLGLVLISHDLNVVETIADRVAVMYLGKIVEIGATAEVMRSPRHAYTRTLLNARLVADPRLARRRRTEEGVDHGLPERDGGTSAGACHHRLRD
jgi:ABC-type oligopeptide transport system ATPase subunit